MHGLPQPEDHSPSLDATQEEAVLNGVPSTPAGDPKLRRALEEDELEAALQLLVERAQYITGATGAALALPHDNEMVCRASAGGCAPAVGARLQVRSGLTGESIARRQLLRCDNTESDPRVNLETCRALGIASIVVLPLLRANGEVRGLFELYSDHRYAFEERDLVALERMAGLTSTALDLAEQQHGSIRPPGRVAQPEKPPETAAISGSAPAAAAIPTPIARVTKPAATSAPEPARETAEQLASAGPSPSESASKAVESVVPGTPAAKADDRNATLTEAPTLPATPNESPSPVSLATPATPPPEPASAPSVGAAPTVVSAPTAAAERAEIAASPLTTEASAVPSPVAVPAGPLTEPSQAAHAEPAVIPETPAQSPTSLPESMLRVRKCASCGFPVSEGRTLCLDCEKKQAEGGTERSAEPRTVHVAAAELPSFLANAAPVKESWLANHVNLLAILVLIVGILVAVVVFR